MSTFFNNFRIIPFFLLHGSVSVFVSNSFEVELPGVCDSGDELQFGIFQPNTDQ